MYCENCGNKLTGGFVFCRNCNHKIKVSNKGGGVGSTTNPSLHEQIFPYKGKSESIITERGYRLKLAIGIAKGIDDYFSAGNYIGGTTRCKIHLFK